MKYLAIFLREISEYTKSEKDSQGKKRNIVRPNFIRVGETEFSPLEEFIHFKKHSSYPVQIEAFSYQNKDAFIYFYDYDNMNLIGLETLLKYGMKPTDLNKVTGKKIVFQIVQGAKNVQGNPLIYIVLPMVTTFIGLIMGFWMGGGFG